MFPVGLLVFLVDPQILVVFLVGPKFLVVFSCCTFGGSVIPAAVAAAISPASATSFALD